MLNISNYKEWTKKMETCEQLNKSDFGTLRVTDLELRKINCFIYLFCHRKS